MPQSIDAGSRLRRLQQTWNTLGEIDPMWAVLSYPTKFGRHWDTEQFFSTGEREIAGVMDIASRVHADLPRRRALDFGCGVGRLSRALARRFASVTGVDIAPSMIRAAKQFNTDVANCEFILNEQEDLRVFPERSFDLIYTRLVLQHMKPQFALKYIRDFVRIAAPGGAIVFQLPDKPVDVARRLKAFVVLPLLPIIPRVLLKAYLKWRYPHAPDYMRDAVPDSPMEMYGLPKAQIVNLMDELGAPVVFSDEETGGGWLSYRYFAIKR